MGGSFLYARSKSLLLTLSVLNDLGGLALHDSDARVRRAEIDTNNPKAATKVSILRHQKRRDGSKNGYFRLVKGKKCLVDETTLCAAFGKNIGHLRGEVSGAGQGSSNSVLFFQKCA